MARVESNQNPQPKRTPPAQPKVVKPNQGKRKWLYSCLIAVVVATLFFVGLAGWAVAETGLARVPLMTDWFYEKPTPERYVMPGISTEAFIQASVEKQLSERLRRSGGQLNDTSVTLHIPEDSLTTTLQEVMAQQQGLLIDASRVQVVAGDDIGLQLFLPIDNNAQESALVVHLTPRVTSDNELDVEATDTWVGDLHVPGFVTSAFLNSTLRTAMAGINDSLREYARIDSIDVQDGVVQVRGEFTVDIHEVR